MTNTPVEVEYAVTHIKEWVRRADLGQRRVVLRDPLRDDDEIILRRVRQLGIVKHDQGRWLLEKAF